MSNTEGPNASSAGVNIITEHRVSAVVAQSNSENTWRIRQYPQYRTYRNTASAKRT